MVRQKDAWAMWTHGDGGRAVTITTTYVADPAAKDLEQIDSRTFLIQDGKIISNNAGIIYAMTGESAVERLARIILSESENKGNPIVGGGDRSPVIADALHNTRRRFGLSADSHGSVAHTQSSDSVGVGILVLISVGTLALLHYTTRK